MKSHGSGMVAKRKIGSSYVFHANSFGPVEKYFLDFEINNLNGIYLSYLFACWVGDYKIVKLGFNVNLRPQTLEVVTEDGSSFSNWRLENFDNKKFDELCVALNEDPLLISREKLAQKFLLEVEPESKVSVPAYRFVSDSSLKEPRR